ncbi:ComEC/Rec2 family competence protein [Pedobacter chitinilyticus]|nr:MBL fold metallo-hydrolase [Pedobacter chitinilyticus]
MQVKVNMLDVSDGDAIIVELEKSGQRMVMVIDGGMVGHYLTKLKPKLQEVLKRNGKAAPDIVVCTHYDSDHIGGLIPLIEDYIDGVKEVWVHETPEVLKDLGNGRDLMDQVVEHADELVLDSAAKVGSNGVTMLQEKAEFLIESIGQLKQLLSLVPERKVRNVFHGDGPKFAHWPEVKVLGPTREYFEELFPPNKKSYELLSEELREHVLFEGFNRFQQLAGLKSCDKLKDEQTASITATNRASIIIAIDCDKGRLLFTGDAGISSFKRIPDWERELRDLYFLKIPHHGSNNNISKEISELMNPVHAYNSGNRHQDDEVLDCFDSKARNFSVKTTKLNGDLSFEA